MNILVLGGNRYFGKLVLQKLLKKKNKIYLVNRNTRKEKFKNKNLIHICSERKKLKNFKYLFKGIIFDFVFDNIAYKLEDVKNLHNLLDGNIRHYIFTSSVMTYFNLSLKHEVKEKEWFKKKNIKIMLKNYKSREIKYALDKSRIENYLINNKKIKYTILRVHNVLGKEDFSGKTQRLLSFDLKNLKGNKISKKDFIQFCFKDDLVKVILKIFERNKKNISDIFNVANKKINIRNFYLKLKKFNNFKKIGTDRKNKYQELFPLPVNILLNNKKIRSKLKINFSSLDRIFQSIC